MADALDSMLNFDFGGAGGMLSIFGNGAWADWLMYGSIVAVIAWFIWDSFKYNKRVLMEDESGSVPVFKFLQAKDAKDALGKPMWFIKKARKLADTPPQDCTSVLSNGKLIARCKKTITGDIIWLPWSNDSLQNLTGLSAHDKEVLAANYQRSRDYTRETNLMSILDKHGGGLIVLVIVAVIFLFGGDFVKEAVIPTIAAAKEIPTAWGHVAELNNQNALVLKEIHNDVREIKSENQQIMNKIGLPTTTTTGAPN